MVYFVERGEESAVKTFWVLFNASSNTANRCLRGTYAEQQVEGKEAVTQAYLDAISDFIEEDIRDCLTLDGQGKSCLETKSPVDLENSLALPRGDVFHGGLIWPFAEEGE